MEPVITPQAEIEKRIGKLQNYLNDQSFDGTLIIFNTDMYYFTGTVQNSFLYVPAQGDPVLMIKKSLKRGKNESPLKNIVPIKSLKEIPAITADFGYPKIKKLGMELDVIPFNIYRKYQDIFPCTEIVDISPAIREIRSVKSDYEIELLRNSLKVMHGAFSAVPNFLKEGMREIELAALIEAEMRKQGLSGCSKMRAFNQDYFLGNVCAGTSGAVSSYFDGPVGGWGVSPSHSQGAGWKKINRNEVVYIDYTCMVNGYIGDQTRIFCLGELSPKMLRAYDATLYIESELIKLIKPGIPAEIPHIMALEMAEKMGLKDNFMGYKGEQVKFLGHGLGLEMDELPILAKGIKTPLLPGMAFALEPKFVFPEGAIGIENSYIMTEKGPECISITPEVITYI